MMSMDKSMLPSQYSEKFQMAQYSAPPLSYPLVARTFQKTLGKAPFELFDEFSKEAVAAASIGQVHKAKKDGHEYAVKVQYPGVADSVSSDLKLVKPFAVNLLGLNEKEVEYYMEEVETMLLSETDYQNELSQSVRLSGATSHINGLFFPKYYEEFSGPRILTMDWIQGMHLDRFLLTNPSQEVRNKIGQALWDFYDYQIHQLKEVHADPHPGNFLMNGDGTLGIIDFGAVKVLPEDYYRDYFQLLDRSNLENDKRLMELFDTLSFIHPEDTESDREELFGILKYTVELLGRPFGQPEFDFSEESYFQEIYSLGEKTMEVKPLRKSKRPRGSKHGLYLNRTYFGLYSILHELGAKVNTGR
jgi:predicted unusual protein kinase regulating ubiquinone biosynthesis (AarF/ABC1/UbiB family)